MHVVCGWVASKKQEGGGESIILCCKGETLVVDQAGNKSMSYMHHKQQAAYTRERDVVGR